jgi:hypothetical protein
LKVPIHGLQKIYFGISAFVEETRGSGFFCSNLTALFFSTQTAKASFNAIDTDSSGTISFEEFFTWWKNAGIDSSSSTAAGDPTASLQAKLASRNLVRYLANSLSKARSGVSAGSGKKDEIHLDLNVIAGEIQRFAQGNTRVQVNLKQNADSAGMQPTLELAFSLLDGSDPNVVDAKIREAVREALDMARAIAPTFNDTTYGIRKSADGSRDQYFFKIPVRLAVELASNQFLIG